MKVVCCFLEFENKIWIVSRHNTSTSKSEWDIPADKVNEEESNTDAVSRIVAKETGYAINAECLIILGNFDLVSNKNESYTMFAYKAVLEQPFPIKPRVLHGEWQTPEACVAKPDLIKNFANLLNLVGYLK